MAALGSASRQRSLQVSQDRIRLAWPELPDRLRRRWRRLTEDDVSFPGGSAAYLAGVLQDRYGVDKREALLQVCEFENEL